MKKFYLYTLMCVLFGASALQASAEDFTASDFFGTWKFTSTLEVTDKGQEMKDEFKAECEVIIKRHDGGIYDMVILGIGGGTTEQPVNNVDNVNHQLNIINPNGSGTLWASATMADGNGKYPYGTTENNWKDSYNNLKLDFDSISKDITIPDFTAVTPDHANETTIILAKFTNCKMTMVSKEVIEAADLSGEYKFIAQYPYEASAFPTTFMMSLSSTSAAFTSYDANIAIEGYNEVTVPATFDGYTLSFMFDEVYLNDEKTVAFSHYNYPDSLKSNWDFVVASDKVLSMDTPIGISKQGDSTFVMESYYHWGGSLVKQVERVGRSGSYQFACENFQMFSEKEEDKANYTADVTLTLTFDEAQQKYYVTEFMGFDTYSMNYGGIPCVETDNVIEMDITGGYNYLENEYTSDDYMKMIYVKLYDGLGGLTNKVAITFNEDGTCTLGDFFVVRENVEYDADWNATTTPEFIAFYGSLTGALVPETFAGTYTAAPAVREVYVDSLATLFTESFDITIVLDEAQQKYYVTEFMGFDTYSMNYGGIPCKETEDGLELDITGGYNYLELLYQSDDYMSMGYYKLFDAEGTTKNTIKLTFDGKNCTIDPFLVQRVDMVYDADWNAVETITKLAYYGDEPSAIEEVAAAKNAIAAKDGVIYVEGGNRVMVYSINGACIFNGTATQISGLDKGVYVVKSGNTVVKVAL
ncbi:MAG: hypothetical protein Q4F99_06900 [bacterium]|nr:hypothetical protein [bacterium]